jgi:hypothetical protein
MRSMRHGVSGRIWPKNRSKPTAMWRGHPFDRTCWQHGVEHLDPTHQMPGLNT